MKIDQAIQSFAALSQETRLQAFRILVEHGPQGIAVGELSKQLGIPHNTLSFHLSHLSEAGLVTSSKQGRSVIYCADLNRAQALVKFLLENCCAVSKTACLNVEKLLKSCKC
jgi:ArsR family transcriptional regulator, arsenate/arsenite/antimonite-responsive transcriptional repressor